LIRAELERIIRIPPDYAMKHSALAIILSATGEPEKARQETLIALNIDPTDPAALSLAKKMGIDVKVSKSAISGHP
jgi:Tfp pilus assembly protein PilF